MIFGKALSGFARFRRSQRPPKTTPGVVRDYMSHDKAQAPRFLFLAMYDPQGLSTIVDQVEKLCALSRFRFDLVNFWGPNCANGLRLPPSLDLRDYDVILVH